MERSTCTTSNIQNLTNSAFAGSGQHISGNDIRNVGKIACLFTISVNTDGLLLDDSLTEAMKGHIWSLARSIDCKVTKRNRWQFEILIVQLTKVLGGQFCDTIGRKGTRQSRLSQRKHTNVPVDRG